MKRKSYILVLIVTLICSACNDWLTVQPETTMDAPTLMETDNGVRQVLNGVYLRATGALYSPSGDLGGGNWLEDMANTYAYNPVNGGFGYYWANHIFDYNTEDQDGIIQTTFLGLYNMIANLNSLINEMNVNKLTPEVYSIVRGEAFALRACCHLDLIRIWGPVPSVANATKNYLPYVRVNDPGNYEYYTFDRYMDYLQADLDSAEVLLSRYEPVLSTTFEQTEQTSLDWSYRKSRMNYFGVLALQARTALWRGDSEKALRYAKLVKNATNEDGSFRFRLTTPADDVSDYTVSDRTHYTEHICGVKCEKFDALAFGSPWSFRTMSKSNSSNYLKELYGDDFSSDLRYTHFWKSGSGSWQLDPETGQYVYVISAYTIGKYDDFTVSASSQHNFPVVRLPEMYFIIMECGTLAEANILYEEYCGARNIVYEPLTEENKQERVMLESVREYIAEGQNFFTYKRNNARRMVGAETDWSADDYTVSIPREEYLNIK